MAAERVRVFGFWASPFALRVEWALKLKGVEDEYIDEDMTRTKSPELLHYNPVTKQIPVLVHGDKALAESLVIVQYIDEVWSEGHPIMPKAPYEFWAKFAEDKVPIHPSYSLEFLVRMRVFLNSLYSLPAYE